MPQIKVLGNVAQIISDLKKDDIEELEKLAPSALVVYEKDEEEDRDVPVFKIGVGEKGSIGDFGITFDGKTRQGGYATVSQAINFDGDDDALMEVLADKLMKPYAYLKEIEEIAPKELDKVKATRAAFIDSITLE